MHSITENNGIFFFIVSLFMVFRLSEPTKLVIPEHRLVTVKNVHRMRHYGIAVPPKSDDEFFLFN